MPINRKLEELQNEIDKEGNSPDVNKIRKEHQFLAERNKNLILNFSIKIRRLLISIFIVLAILIIFSGYYNDKISCEREGPTRTSLIALKKGFMEEAVAREKVAKLEKGTDKATINYELAHQLHAEASEVKVNQLKCSGIPQGK